MFYPEKRKHTSPSALALWKDNRAEFERRYFAGEKTFVNKAMIKGTQVHREVELGMREVQIRYEHAEQEIVVPFKAGRTELELKFIPDSYEIKNGKAKFVDYKTGSAWSKKRAEDDFKQAVVAWGLYLMTGSEVSGAIEHIADDGTTKVYRVRYTTERLEQVGDEVKKLVKEINKGYEEWLTRTDVFMDEDALARFAELKAEERRIKDELQAISEQISGQMEAGGLSRAKTPFGTFYFTERKRWEYPDDVVKIEQKLKKAKKEYEATHEPKTITRTLSFRA